MDEPQLQDEHDRYLLALHEIASLRYSSNMVEIGRCFDIASEALYGQEIADNITVTERQQQRAAADAILACDRGFAAPLGISWSTAHHYVKAAAPFIRAPLKEENVRLREALTTIQGAVGTSTEAWYIAHGALGDDHA
jgi:hypothetical protein